MKHKPTCLHEVQKCDCPRTKASDIDAVLEELILSVSREIKLARRKLLLIEEKYK